MIRRCVVPGLIVLMWALSAHQASTVDAVVPVNFVRGTVSGAGFVTDYPTTLESGPDGRLYVADGSGKIQALTLDSNDQVTAVQQITTAANLQEVYGIAFDPDDASSPSPIYVTNTISGFGDAGQAPDGAYSGKVTKISGPGYATRVDIISGLPVSNSGHQANGLAFGPDGRLYIGQGSTTNAGVPNSQTGLFQRQEAPTSSAILVADVTAGGFNGNITYSPPNIYSNSVVKTGGDVSVYASGLRNPYDLMWHSNGILYNTDNGPNIAAAPNTYGSASTTCATDSGADVQGPDELNVIEAGRYYGHPNRNRGVQGDAAQCVYRPPTDPSSVNYRAPIGMLPPSSDGLAEYKSAVFGGQMQGDLLYVSWVTNELHRVKLSPDGSSIVYDATLATNLTNALDVAVAADGTIYVAEWGAGKITYFRPNEAPVGAPTVTGIVPDIGPATGGQAVTVTGTNFSTDTTVTIGGSALTGVLVQNSTTITGVTSSNSAGIKDVVATHHAASGTLSGGYEYVAGGGLIPPVANAGGDTSAPVSHEIHGHATLDGTGSFDPDGATLNYSWTEGAVTLSTQSKVTVQLEEGVHLIDLTVTDADGLTDNDQVRVDITSGPSNPDPFYCFDVNGNTAVNAQDLGLIAQVFGKKFGQPGYTRLKDWNANRTINAQDLGGTARDFTSECPLEDQMFRTTAAAIEQYQNVNAALNAGFIQVTQFVPGQGRHLVKSSLYDTTFDPAVPEGLIYEPDASSPGGWRLGGALFVMPIQLNPLLPDGYPGTDDTWHYHDFLCFYPNGTVTLDSQSVCTANGGTYLTNVGWLLHAWTHVPAPYGAGRYTDNNTKFDGVP